VASPGCSAREGRLLAHVGNEDGRRSARGAPTAKAARNNTSHNRGRSDSVRVILGVLGPWRLSEAAVRESTAPRSWMQNARMLLPIQTAPGGRVSPPGAKRAWYLLLSAEYPRCRHREGRGEPSRPPRAIVVGDRLVVPQHHLDRVPGEHRRGLRVDLRAQQARHDHAAQPLRREHRHASSLTSVAQPPINALDASDETPESNRLSVVPVEADADAFLSGTLMDPRGMSDADATAFMEQHGKLWSDSAVAPSADVVIRPVSDELGHEIFLSKDFFIRSATVST
jgi:hypothetical protein